MSAEEDRKGFRVVRADTEFEASLMLEPETRHWQLYAEGPASAMLAFFVDSSDESIITKFFEEARFDSMIRYATEEP